MAGFIPKEELAGFKRWQVASFDRPAPPRPGLQPPAAPTAAAPAAAPSAPAVAEPPPGPSPEEIERLYNEARQAGFQAGHAEGYAAGEAAGRNAALDEAAQMLGLIDNLQQAIAGVEQTVAEQVLELAIEVAARVLGSRLERQDDFLLPIIREAIAALPVNHGHVTLFLNPADAERVRELIGEQLAQSGTQIAADDTIGTGGCQLRAGASEIDATLETRWKRVLEAIGLPPRPWQNS